MNVVITLLEFCISFFSLVTHPSVPEAQCLGSVLSVLHLKFKKLSCSSGLCLHGRCLLTHFLTNKKEWLYDQSCAEAPG